MEKVILLVDDENESTAVLDGIKSNLKTNNINVVAKYINPVDREFWDKNKDPQLDLVIKGIESSLKGKKAHLIIIDQYYSEGCDFTGLCIINRIRSIRKFKNTPIFLASGKRDKIVRTIFNNEVADENDKVDELSKLLNYKIEGFLDKDYRSKAIEFLKKETHNDILSTKLREYEDKGFYIHTFEGAHRKLHIKNIVNKIDENDTGVNIILREMIDLSLAHYINIEDELQ